MVSIPVLLNLRCPSTHHQQTTYLVYTSTEDEVSFLIPLKCKDGTFVLAQSTGQVTCKRRADEYKENRKELFRNQL